MKFKFDNGEFRIYFKRYMQVSNETMVPYRPDLMEQMQEFPIITMAKIIDIYWNTISVGYSRCSKKDHFQKELGRKLALERAIINLSKDFRCAIWKTYLER